MSSFNNNVPNYFNGIPSSIVAYSQQRGQLQTYDNIFDTQTDVNQQLTTIQNRISDLTESLNELRILRSLTTTTQTNLIANGDCSQFTLANPMSLTANAGGNNTGLIMQGKAHPIMDRWYHVAELSAFNPVYFKCVVKRDNISNYIAGLPLWGTYPSNTDYCLRAQWYNANNTNPVFTLEHTAGANSDKYGGMIALQHMIPNVRQFAVRSAKLGFWIWSNRSEDGYVQILRQYNQIATGTIADSNTSNSLERILIKSFSPTPNSWTYITIPITLPPLLNKTINATPNGLVVQIGPCFYIWKAGSPNTFVTYGSTTPFTSTSPDVQYVIAEIQLRLDGDSPSTVNFPTNDKESDRTLPYMNYCSTTNPNNIPTTSTVTDLQILSVAPAFPSGQTITSGGVLYTTYTTANMVLNYASNMITQPSVAYFCYYDKANSNAPKIGVRYDTVSTYDSAYQGQMLWENNSVTGIQIDTYYITKPFVLGIDSGITPATSGIISAGVSNAIFTSVRGLAGLVESAPTSQLLMTASHGKWGYFVFMVPETHIGKTENVEVLYIVDYYWTALTSRPFKDSVFFSSLM